MDIVNENVVSYIHSLEKDDIFLGKLEKYAKEENVPIIRKETASFLKTFLKVLKPKNILELGSAIGYSAILMGFNTDEDTKIYTIENYEKRIPIAKENINKAGFENKIILLEGDAIEKMQELESVFNNPTDIDKKFDFVFIDAAKGSYKEYFLEAEKMLSKKGVIICDNVLQNGDVAVSRFAVERRDRTIHSRMREFLYEIKNNDSYETSIVPIGDGLSISVKLT